MTEPLSPPTPARSNDGEVFRRFARNASVTMGSAWAFLAALLLVLGWGAFGPVFHYSENWQLLINTATTIVTFLMVFLIQNAQNREARVMELKLDELIRAIEPARNQLVRMDEMSDAELARIEADFHELHERASRLRAARAKPGA